MRRKWLSVLMSSVVLLAPPVPAHSEDSVAQKPKLVSAGQQGWIQATARRRRRAPGPRVSFWRDLLWDQRVSYRIATIRPFIAFCLLCFLVTSHILFPRCHVWFCSYRLGWSCFIVSFLFFKKTTFFFFFRVFLFFWTWSTFLGDEDDWSPINQTHHSANAWLICATEPSCTIAHYNANGSLHANTSVLLLCHKHDTGQGCKPHTYCYWYAIGDC